MESKAPEGVIVEVQNLNVDAFELWEKQIPTIEQEMEILKKKKFTPGKMMPDPGVFFRPLESIPLLDEVSEEKYQDELREQVFRSRDPETVRLIRELETPTPEELETKLPENFDPLSVYSEMENKFPGEFGGDFVRPTFIPFSVPLDELAEADDSFIPDDLYDDLKAFEKKHNKEKLKELNREKWDEELMGFVDDDNGIQTEEKEIVERVEEVNISAVDGKMGKRSPRMTIDENGRDVTKFFEIAFVRIGAFYASGFVAGALGGYAIGTQAAAALEPNLHRSTVMNSMVKHGSNTANSFGILAFLYTCCYFAIRDNVYEMRIKDRQTERMYIHTSAAVCTGMIYQASFKKRRGMLVSGAIAGAAALIATYPTRNDEGLVRKLKGWKAKMTSNEDSSSSFFSSSFFSSSFFGFGQK